MCDLDYRYKGLERGDASYSMRAIIIRVLRVETEANAACGDRGYEVRERGYQDDAAGCLSLRSVLRRAPKAGHGRRRVGRVVLYEHARVLLRAHVKLVLRGYEPGHEEEKHREELGRRGQAVEQRGLVLLGAM